MKTFLRPTIRLPPTYGVMAAAFIEGISIKKLNQN